MVLFQAIRNAITQNPNAALQVAVYRIRPQPMVERFKLPTIRHIAAVIPVRVRHRVPSPVRSEGSVNSEESKDSVPLPTRIMSGQTLATRPSPAAAPTPPAAAPTPPAAAPTPPTSFPATRPTKGGGGNGPVVDPICIGLEQADAMYAIATANVRQSLECEEARRLEGRIGELYKTESGRSRGWTKTRLEAFMIPRAAVGSRVLPKAAFDWGAIWTDKDASAILDFVCLAKGIRIAVWKDAEKVVGIWPAADSVANASKKDIPIYHVSSTGSVFAQPRTVLQEGWTLLAPYSVEHGLEKLSLEELDGLAETMGIPIPSGKKPHKVRALATARMRMRFE